MILDNLESELEYSNENLGDEDEINRMYEIINPGTLKYLLMDTAEDSEREPGESVQGYIVSIEKGAPALLNHLRNRKHVIYLGNSTGKMKNDLINGLGLNRNSLDFEMSDILDVMEEALSMCKHYPIIVVNGMHKVEGFNVLAEKLQSWSSEKKANVIFLNMKPNDLRSLVNVEKVKSVDLATINTSFVAQRLRESTNDLADDEIALLIAMTGGEPDDIDEILQRRQMRGLSTAHALNSFCKQDSENLINLLMSYSENQFLVAILVLDEVMKRNGSEGVSLLEFVESMSPSFNMPVKTVYKVVKDLEEEKYISQDEQMLKVWKPIQRNTMRCALTSPWISHRVSKNPKLSQFHEESADFWRTKVVKNGERMSAEDSRAKRGQSTEQLSDREYANEVFSQPKPVQGVRPLLSIAPRKNDDSNLRDEIIEREKKNYNIDDVA